MQICCYDRHRICLLLPLHRPRSKRLCLQALGLTQAVQEFAAEKPKAKPRVARPPRTPTLIAEVRRSSETPCTAGCSPHFQQSVYRQSAPTGSFCLPSSTPSGADVDRQRLFCTTCIVPACSDHIALLCSLVHNVAAFRVPSYRSNSRRMSPLVCLSRIVMLDAMDDHSLSAIRPESAA